MKYMGSKRLIARHILPIILKDRKPGQLYVEPFVGGGNSFNLVSNPRLGADCHSGVIQALTLIRDDPNSLPVHADDISPSMYQELKISPKHPWHGYVGFACSFGGKWYGGRIKSSYPPATTEHVHTQYKAAQKQNQDLRGSILEHRTYKELSYIEDSIIYCDPPYQGTTRYSGVNFNHDEFYRWCVDMSKRNNKVFISEYDMPECFECVWEMSVRSTLSSSKKQIKVERLFIVKT